MKLKKLIKDLPGITLIKGSKEIEIIGLSNHSGRTQPGDLFIARKGATYDGSAYIADAILAGAVAIVTDMYNPFLGQVVQIVVEDITATEALLAHRFFHDPSQELFLVGITGTSGKTTTAYLIKYLLDLKGATGLMGSIERLIGPYRLASDINTPDCMTTHRLLREMCVHGAKHAVMEVSSHGLSQRRTAGLAYDVAIFTNLTPEHLDYHQTMEIYASEKAKLLTQIKEGGHAIVNVDDLFVDARDPITFGIDRPADWRAINITYSLEGTRFEVEGRGEIEMPLVGRFNVYNALSAIATASLAGISWNEIALHLKTFPGVPGRLQRVPNDLGLHIFVDYSHKADALENVLKTLTACKTHRLITLFGCGGNRDREKRPRMARAAEQYSDYVVVTSDNPRNEDPEEIIREIITGFTEHRFVVEVDRAQAIQKAIEMAKPGDIVLIAGKGHESYQILNGKTIDFDDVVIAREIANRLSSTYV